MNLHFLTKSIDMLIDCFHLSDLNGTPLDYRRILEKSKLSSILQKPLELQALDNSKIMLAMAGLSAEQLQRGQKIIFEDLWNQLP
ncbi:MAG: hypothetical protein EOM62_19835, partial [Bacteroidia bacterium]|nr:hypothetical protein [Bacteroidia bacterium]